jgi:hypothetical protein
MSAQINLFHQISLCNKAWDNFGDNSSNNGKVFILNKKIVSIIVDADLEIHVEVC